MINNTGGVCNQAGEGCPALRKADPPGSRLIAAIQHSHTHTELGSRLGSSATNYLNMVLQRPLKSVQLETIENDNNTKRNWGRFMLCGHNVRTLSIISLTSEDKRGRV